MITIKIHVAKPFGNLYRKETVLIVVKVGDTYVFGDKVGFYPPGITRLLGGGVRENETPEHAAVREIEEELSVTVTPHQLKRLDEVLVEAEDDAGKKYSMTTHLFFIELPDTGSLVAGDDVTHLAFLTKEEFARLIERYTNLPHDLWRTQDGEDFSWGDYGAFYGPVHEIALQGAETSLMKRKE